MSGETTLWYIELHEYDYGWDTIGEEYDFPLTSEDRDEVDLDGETGRIEWMSSDLILRMFGSRVDHDGRTVLGEILRLGLQDGRRFDVWWGRGQDV